MRYYLLNNSFYLLHREEKVSGDLISRSALLKEVRENKELFEKERVYLEGLLLNAPTADIVCPDCYIRYSQGYIDGATNNPKECKTCDYYKFAQSCINGIVEIINKNGLTSLDELLDLLKKGDNKAV